MHIPGAEPAAAWQLLARLIDNGQPSKARDLKTGIWNGLAKTESAFQEIAAVEKTHANGMRIYRHIDESARFSTQRPRDGWDDDDRLELIAVDWVFGTEELSAYSECLTDLEESPGIFMCRTDAEKLNLAAGDRVAVELESGTLEASIHLKENMAAGMLIIPRHKNLGWQKMNSGQTRIRPDQISKV